MVGVDTDQYATAPEFADVWLTSVQKNVDVAVFDAIFDLQFEGSLGDEYVGDLANGGADIAPYHDFANITPTSLQEEVNELRAMFG